MLLWPTLAVLSAGSALAQEQPRSQGALEEVIVTAQKRAENVQNVPIAMQAYSGETLQDAGINQITDVTRLAPNLNVVVQNAMSQHIVIRGVGTNEFFGNAPSSVGTYMDEVTMNSSYMSTLALFDMERVEVLRGPQNSLFGEIRRAARSTTSRGSQWSAPTASMERRSSPMATAILPRSRAVSRFRPDRPLRSVLRAFITRATASGPTSTPATTTTETRSAIQGERHWPGSRPKPRVSPSMSIPRARVTRLSRRRWREPSSTIRRCASTTRSRPSGYSDNIDWRHGNLNTIGNIPTVNIEGFDRLTQGWQDVWNGGSQRGDLDVDGGYVKLNHDFGASTLTFIGSYDKTHGFYEEDNTGDGNVQGAGTPGVTHDVLIIDMDQEYKQYTGELRLASNDNEAKLRWIAGLYYLKEDATLAQDIRFGDNGFPGAHPSAAGITPPSLFDVIPNPYGNTVSFSISDLVDRSYSGYGQIDWQFAEAWGLTVGLRYTHDKKSNPSYYAGAFIKPLDWDPSIYVGESAIRELAAGLPNCVPKTDPGYIPFVHCADTNTSREDLSNDEVGGKLGVQFHASDAVMLYGSYSRGFKSGKFDMEFLHTDDTPFPQRPLDPETLDAFEVGMKSTLLDRSLLVNAAVFYYIWKDQQVFNVGVQGPEFFNLPESHLKGAELETNWVPADGWNLSADFGWLDTELTDVTGIDFDLGQGDFQDGHELPLSPEFTATAAISKTIVLASSDLTLHADYRYQSSSKVKYSPQVPIDEYTDRNEINARIGFAFGANRQYEIALFGNNLTGEKYCVEIQDLRGVSSSFYCVPNEGEVRYGVQARIGF